MKELMYDINSGLIAGILLVSMIAAIEVGFRLGVNRKDSTSQSSKEQINAAQSSFLGLLALILAFTFSLSLQRFDSRSDAVVDEANAIGTAYLRAQLLPGALRSEMQPLLRDYLDLRVQASSLSMVEQEQGPLVAQTAQLQNRLWDGARRAAAMNASPVPSGLFVQSINDLIDSFGRRDAAVSRHVPEGVLLLLYGTFLIAGVIVGFTAGIGGQRPSLSSLALIALIIVIIFVVLDLDRPRRGLIQVDQKPLLDLQASVHAEMGVISKPSMSTTTPPPASSGPR